MLLFLFMRFSFVAAILRSCLAFIWIFGKFQPNFTDMSLRENVTTRLTMQAGMNDIMP